jgi:hypothetical protein
MSVSEHIVNIKGHRYRYAYDRATRKTQYLGPVGDAPPLSESDFHRTIITPSDPETFGVVGIRDIELGSIVGPRGERGWIEIKTYGGQMISLIPEDFNDKRKWRKISNVKPGDILKFTGDPLGSFDVEVITKRDIKTGKIHFTEEEREQVRAELRQELVEQRRMRDDEEDKALDQLQKEIEDVLQAMNQYEGVRK